MSFDRILPRLLPDQACPQGGRWSEGLGSLATGRGARAGIAGLAIFLLMGALGMLGVPAGVDVTVAKVHDPAHAPLLAAWFLVVAALWSPEMSILYGVAGSALLWRAGAGRWSPAPMAFLLLVPLEVLCKLAVHPPYKLPVLKMWTAPPSPLVASPLLGETFFSGSAVRTGFLCALCGIVLWKQGGIGPRVTAAGIVALGLLSSSIKVYGGYHWVSNEVVGQLLGISMALLVAFPLAERMAAGRRQATARARGRSRTHSSM